MSIKKAQSILADIKKGSVAPIYFLMGEESYYIDLISKYIETHVLSEEEKGFNQTVFYGRDISVDEIVSYAKRYPLMAEKQVIIIKEAQDLSRNLDALQSYIENPMPSTVLVFCYKYKSLDRRRKISKTLAKNAVLFESKKLYDNQVPSWLQAVAKEDGYTISPKATHMLVEFLGTNLSKIKNELDKLQLIVPKGTEITPEHIEENIGISKDFNNFELQNAIGTKDYKKAFQIAQYFSQDTSSNPFVLTLSLMHSFFTRLLKYHALENKGQAPKVLGVSPYFIDQYRDAARAYPIRQVTAILAELRELDLMSKGVGASNLSHEDLLKELLIRVFV